MTLASGYFFTSPNRVRREIQRIIYLDRANETICKNRNGWLWRKLHSLEDTKETYKLHQRGSYAKGANCVTYVLHQYCNSRLIQNRCYLSAFFEEITIYTCCLLFTFDLSLFDTGQLIAANCAIIRPKLIVIKYII
jgi:hypothetical protein